jgi:hypothetical protein
VFVLCLSLIRAAISRLMTPMCIRRMPRRWPDNGATLGDIAEAFKISTRTLHRWTAEHKELSAAIQSGHEVFGPKIQRALAERATGFWVTWDEKERNPVSGQMEDARKVRYFPPDTTAVALWLTNMMKSKWRHVQKHEVEVTRPSVEEALIQLRRLSTRPIATGSAPCIKTIGIVWVAAG